MKLLTLAIIKQEERILLGLKKRGFGAGLWNGFGGKIEKGESIMQAVIREIKEEIGLDATALEEKGKIVFELPSVPEALEVHILEVLNYTGTPVESEEMLPRWFKISEIPYGQMWKDDPYWLPLFLEGKRFTGWFKFDQNNNILDYKLEIVDEKE
jgi:8-oxo-dGTP diphosphatase/2-hydroxy-dATP diphosphatase